MKAVILLDRPFNVKFSAKSEDGTLHHFTLNADTGMNFLVATYEENTYERILKEFCRWRTIDEQTLSVNSARRAKKAMDDAREILLKAFHSL